MSRPPFPRPGDAQFARNVLEDQAAGMARLFPRLRPIWRTRWGIAWRGTLRPVAQSYTIELGFIVGAVFRDVEVAYRPPRARVLAPELRRRPEAPMEPIPHVYQEDHPVVPCLYYPGEWNVFMPLAETVVPWLLHWFVHYELWQATGEWTGGGRHPDGDPERIGDRDGRSVPGHVATRRLALALNPHVMSEMGFLVRRAHGAAPSSLPED